MRKRVLTSLVVAILLLITACGKAENESSKEQSAVDATEVSIEEEPKELEIKEAQVDPVAQKIMNDIEKIGDVELDDTDTIVRLTELYSTLTDDQKKQVSNYIDLVNAQETLSELQKEAKEQEEKGTEKEVEAATDDNPSAEESEEEGIHQLKEGIPAGQGKSEFVGFTGTYEGQYILKDIDGMPLNMDIVMYEDIESEDSPYGTVRVYNEYGEDNCVLYLESAHTEISTGSYDAIFISSNGHGDYWYYGFTNNGYYVEFMMNDSDGPYVMARLQKTTND